MVSKPAGTVSYTKAANYLITAVYYLPSYVSSNRPMCAVSTVGGYQEGAYKADGTFNNNLEN